MIKDPDALIPPLPPGARLSPRGRRQQPNHHLWRNGTIWWFHATFHLPGYLKERVRFPLETAEVEEARARRDFILEAIGSRPRDQDQAA